MSVSAVNERAPHERAETHKLVAIIWVATIVTYLATGLSGGLSTDDAMRLVQVRDWLAGQSWFDLTQYRLAPPEGVLMHWSRLIDLPLGILIRAGELLLPAARAEQIATTVWPASLLLVFLAGCARLARELAGHKAVPLALIFAATSASILEHFRPAAIDHHNAQLALLIWSLALTVKGSNAREAAIAGACCALSIAIGQDIAPAILAVAAMVGIRWLALGEPIKQVTAAFALAFASEIIVLFAATVAPASYLTKSCDAFSIVHVATAAIGGAGLALLTTLRRLNSPMLRLTGIAALGALIAGMIVLAFPACLSSPYVEVDNRLATLWLNQNAEARSFIAMLRDLPQDVLSYFGLVMVGLAAGLNRCLREQGDTRWGWLICVMVLAVLAAMAAWQVRSASAANAIAVALVPAALVRMFAAMDERAIFLGLGRSTLAAALLVSPITLVAIGHGGARALEAAGGWQRPALVSDGAGTCRRPADYAALARLPRGLVVGFVDAGPQILMETPHATLAAPYHRNIKGNAAMYDVFLGSPDEAARKLASRDVVYIAFCPGAPEAGIYAARAPDGLAAVLGRGEVPPFLEQVLPGGTDLAVYRPRR